MRWARGRRRSHRGDRGGIGAAETEEEAAAPARSALGRGDHGQSHFPPSDCDPLAEPRTWPEPKRRQRPHLARSPLTFPRSPNSPESPPPPPQPPQ